jgi:hypothetical protein
MIKKLIPSLLLLSLCLITSVNAQTIIWVAMDWDADADGVNDSQEWVDKLTDEGYTIDFRPGYWDALTEDQVVELNTADLVVISATHQSGVLVNDAAEAALWNSVTVPMMNCCTYALRSTRLNWVNNADASLPNNNGDQGSPLMQVIEPGHPIFNGISLDENNQVQVVDPTLGSGQCTFIGTADVGNGTLIAKTVGNEWLWIAEWKDHVEFYDGAGTYATNLRMTFSIGAHEVGGNDRASNPARGYNLTDEGWKLFLNTIQYMLSGSIDPGKAGGPKPGNGREDVPRDAILSWRPGLYTATNNLYFGTDFNDVNQASPDDPRNVLIDQGMTVTSYDPPGRLESNKIYYWRIDEVNDSDPNSPWRGDVWSFTTGDHIVIDDFEAYNDLNEAEEGSNRIYLTWSDGYANPNVNGSTIGYPAPDFANNEHFVETNIVHGGKQSGPFLYNNTAASYSEVTLPISTLGGDWSPQDINVLSFWFYGDPNNTGAGQLYAKLNNSRVNYSGNATDISAGEWIQWNIDLSDFNANLSNVTQISVGMEKTDALGGEGILFLDDIRLRYVEN